MATRIQLRNDTAANWTSNDPTLAEAEVGVETDTNKLKVGDGVTAWTSLGYFSAGVPPPSSPATVTGTTDTLASGDNGATNVYTNASAVMVTIPTDASDDLADGFECLLVAAGAGGLSLDTTGLTLVGDAPSTTVAQNESLFVKKTATANTWIVLGGGTNISDIMTLLQTVDGTGSGLDADLLDGNEATAFELADADILKADTADTLTVGFDSSDFAAGTKSSGTYTPDPADGNFQVATNGGAHTLAPPSTSCSIVVHYTNNGSAGTITTSGFTAVTGDSLDTTDTNEFVCVITKINDVSVLNVTALQ